MKPKKLRIDPKLDAFYRATTFAAALPDGQLDIRIGQSHPRLDSLLKEQGAGTWAYITACNPGSADLPPEVNDKRHALSFGTSKSKGSEFSWAKADRTNRLGNPKPVCLSSVSLAMQPFVWGSRLIRMQL